MTMAVEDAKQQEEAMFGFLDTDKIQPHTREFEGHLPVLETLGISNYDKVTSFKHLVFKMREAL